MKILTLLTRIPLPARDGGALVILDTLRALSRSGCIVDVFALNTRADAVVPHAESPLSEVTASDLHCNVLRSYPLDTRVTWYGALRNVFVPKRQVWGSRNALSYWTERFVDDKAIEQLVAMYISNGPYDIVYIETLFAAEMGARLKTALRDLRMPVPPLVYRSHNVEASLQKNMSIEGTRPLFERVYRGFLAARTARNERAIVQGVDGVITISEDDANVYRSYAPTQLIESISPGVDVVNEDEMRNAGRQSDTIALLGSMEWAPNVNGTIWFVNEVLPLILRKRPNVVLHIAGRNPLPEVHALHNGISVFMHGEVADANAFRMRYAINVVSVQSAGGIRIKILDCLSLGCPVVTTTAGASGLPPELFDFLTIADSATDFASACVKLLEQPAISYELAQRGRQYVHQHFSWESRTRQLVHFLENVIKRHQGASTELIERLKPRDLIA